MKVLTVIALLITLCLGATPAAAALPRPAQEGAGERLTPNEEQEARELARVFVERFRETNDVAPLVEELFVEDFAERLRHDEKGIPMCFIRREVALRAAPAGLREFYVAQFNFFVLTLEHWISRPGGPDGDGEGEQTLEQMFPQEVAGLLRSEPHFGAYITGDKLASEEPDEAKKDDDDDDRFVTSLKVLGEVTSTTEEVAKALRLHVPSFALMLEAQRARIEDEDLTEVEAPHVETFEDAFYGFPAGTRFIHLNVEPLQDLQLQLYAVKVEDGRLRILSAFPVLGD